MKINTTVAIYLIKNLPSSLRLKIKISADKRLAIFLNPKWSFQTHQASMTLAKKPTLIYRINKLYHHRLE